MRSARDSAKDSTGPQALPGAAAKKRVARAAPKAPEVVDAPVARPVVARKAVGPAVAARKAPATVRVDAAVPSDPPRPKPKLVRDSFTIPKSEYAVLDALKERAARLKRPTKKSEVLRAGIAALHAMNDKAFLSMIKGVPSLKTGRPKAATPPALPAK